MHRTPTIIALAATGLVASAATAETITVCASGCDFTSIPDAIDAASAGDVIDIAAGTYTVDSQIRLGQGGVDKPLTIIGETAADGTPLTSIQATSGTRCFYIFGHVGPDTIIENLIITGGSGMNRGAGIYCKGDPTIINCHFLDNAVAERGAGMYNDGANPTLINCAFAGNSADTGGGMYNDNGSSPALNNCAFTDNSADFGSGMYNFGPSIPRLTNVAICDNSVPQIFGDYTSVGGNCFTEFCACCGVDDGIDSDGDGVPDCIDQCLGEDDTIDTDGDGTPDCIDQCLGEDDTVDSDGDGTPDACDNCPNDPEKTEPGNCGCGVVDTTLAGDLDCDGDVDAADFALLRNQIGVETLGCVVADINGDGEVNGADFAYVLGYWGLCSAP